MKMNEIKGIIGSSNLEMNILITYYQELCEIKIILDEHFKTKKRKGN